MKKFILLLTIFFALHSASFAQSVILNLVDDKIPQHKFTLFSNGQYFYESDIPGEAEFFGTAKITQVGCQIYFNHSEASHQIELFANRCKWTGTMTILWFQNSKQFTVRDTKAQRVQ